MVITALITLDNLGVELLFILRKFHILKGKDYKFCCLTVLLLDYFECYLKGRNKIKYIV